MQAFHPIPALLVAPRSCPQVVGGEEDRLLPPSACGRILEKLGRCAPRLAVLPRCAHLSHEEAPHTLLAFLLPFARDLRDRLR